MSNLSCVASAGVAATAILLAACAFDVDIGHEQQAHIGERAICDTVECPDPAAAVAACDAEWAQASGKTYSIFSLCEPGGTTTNSDCWSDCFRNFCLCGSTAGTPNACPDGDGGEGGEGGEGGGGGGGDGGDEAVECECGTGQAPVSHRYWCCEGMEGTQHGWSGTDHCNPPEPDAGVPDAGDPEPDAGDPES